jgi:hypothetical protein
MDLPPMMRCERRQMSLTIPGCVRLFESAERDPPQPYEGRFACHKCPIGAAHLGRTITAAEQAADDWSSICPRCLRSASRFIQASMCVSCYNRHREGKIGRNRKGSRPQIIARLHLERLAVIEGGELRTIAFPDVVHATEAMVRSAKAAKDVLIIGAPARAWRSPQMELPLWLPSWAASYQESIAA